MTRLNSARLFVGGALFVGALAVVSAVAENPDHVKQLKETRICKNCDLRGADLTGLDLYGAQLQEADLEGAVLTDTNLALANLRGANGVNFAGAKTDKRTTCPDGAAGPCK